MRVGAEMPNMEHALIQTVKDSGAVQTSVNGSHTFVNSHRVVKIAYTRGHTYCTRDPKNEHKFQPAIRGSSQPCLGHSGTSLMHPSHDVSSSPNFSPNLVPLAMV